MKRPVVSDARGTLKSARRASGPALGVAMASVVAGGLCRRHRRAEGSRGPSGAVLYHRCDHTLYSPSNDRATTTVVCDTDATPNHKPGCPDEQSIGVVDVVAAPRTPYHPLSTVPRMEALSRTERELAARSLSLLDHLDTCPVCREDGVRWCEEGQDLQASLRYERLHVLQTG